MYVTPYTCAADGREHLVTDEAFSAGRGNGIVEAVDGHVVVVSAAITAPGARCRACRQVFEELQHPPVNRQELRKPRTPLRARFRRAGTHGR